ncbi:hypothetical protein J7I98_39030 [Streptomyces sp. ISL-98]|uniref:hypothetical protein n=1 Tax=Streptomyces sp. ISL-98 TaxID=2819192 RepID=UPI001BEC29CA|nr:hypothetical protein [Streptomyces sp. ISL-98]MBT2511672.1 hypothetical protein [Streptomyces sp. ISL-98]
MTHMLSRRIAPILILVQVAYIALLEIAFSLGPDTAELDHTNPSGSSGILYTAVIVAAVVTMAGGAALLGLDKARAGTPRAVRTAWLVVLALGELAIATAFLTSITRETFGPDTLVGTAAIAMCVFIALACATEIRAFFRHAPADAHS